MKATTISGIFQIIHRNDSYLLLIGKRKLQIFEISEVPLTFKPLASNNRRTLEFQN